jgi:hypothetical protein
MSDQAVASSINGKVNKKLFILHFTRNPINFESCSCQWFSRSAFLNMFRLISKMSNLVGSFGTTAIKGDGCNCQDLPISWLYSATPKYINLIALDTNSTVKHGHHHGLGQIGVQSHNQGHFLCFPLFCHYFSIVEQMCITNIDAFATHKNQNAITFW